MQPLREKKTPLQFKELSAEECDNRFIRVQEPKYPVRYFSLVREETEVGMLGLEKITEDIAELSLTIFKPYRYKVLSYRSLREIFTFPFSLGFQKVIGWTRRKSWIRLLKKFKACGIRPMDKVPAHDTEEGKFWYEYVKEQKNV